MIKLLILPVVGALVFGLALTVLANHPPTSDFGVDQDWTEAMNQETYWENLWGAECTKYEGHYGFIPAQYDAAVIKSGSTQVHVYSDLTNVGSFTAIGPPNPNDQHPNRRHTAPFSWVMKCTIDQTTTTTQPEETTTTESTTTTTTEATTSTTQPQPTSSSTTTTPGTLGTQPQADTTTTSLRPAPTTTAPTPSTTDPSSPELAVLPLTGIEDWLAFAALALIGAGWMLARGFRAED